MICAWCSVGLSHSEKYCSQCGGPNPHYSDLYIDQRPITNIGKRILEYYFDLSMFSVFQIPLIGTLKRIMVKTPRKLQRIDIILQMSYTLVSQEPETNIFIYTGNIELDELVDACIQMRSFMEQKAIITLETNP